MEALTDALRRELAPWRIDVSLVDFTAVATPMQDKALESASQRLPELPPEGQALYGDILEAVLSKFKKRLSGRHPRVVARAVAHALCSSRPRTRYFVGLDAKLMRVFVADYTSQLAGLLCLQHLRAEVLPPCQFQYTPGRQRSDGP